MIITAICTGCRCLLLYLHGGTLHLYAVNVLHAATSMYQGACFAMPGTKLGMSIQLLVLCAIGNMFKGNVSVMYGTTRV